MASCNVTWAAPTDNSGNGIRRVGDPSNVTITIRDIQGEALPINIANFRKDNGEVVASGQLPHVASSEGVILFSDQTPLPNIYQAGVHEVFISEIIPGVAVNRTKCGEFTVLGERQTVDPEPEDLGEPEPEPEQFACPTGTEPVFNFQGIQTGCKAIVDTGPGPDPDDVCDPDFPDSGPTDGNPRGCEEMTIDPDPVPDAIECEEGTVLQPGQSCFIPIETDPGNGTTVLPPDNGDTPMKLNIGLLLLLGLVVVASSGGKN